MELIGQRSCPPPDDPVLAAAASALEEAGHWFEIFDSEWRGGQFPLEIQRRHLELAGPSILADLGGARDGLRALVDPRFTDIVSLPSSCEV